MKVVLLKNIRGLGQTGEIKEVKGGYALNYLLPHGLADSLTRHSLFVLEAQKKKKERIKNKEEKDKFILVKILNEKNFEIKVKADESGSLYAKIDNKFLANYLGGQGYSVAEEEIMADGPIKKLGDYEIKLLLKGKNILIKLKVNKE